MGVRAHIQNRRVIEYSDGYFSNMQYIIEDALRKVGVHINELGDYMWEIDKSELFELTKKDLETITEHIYQSKDDRFLNLVAEFIAKLKSSNTKDEWCYVDWF